MTKKTARYATLFGFLLFLMTIGVSSITSVLIYRATVKSSTETYIIVLALAGIILFMTTICSLVDIFRRKLMVEDPTQKILDATSQIISGNFDVQIEISKPYYKFTEYDKIMDDINTMAKELSKNEMLKKDFISNVSHEIKTPLAIIQNYAKLLQNDKLDKDTKQQYLETMIITTKRMSNLISNILSLNKLENQAIVPDMIEFDLFDSLSECILAHEDLIEKKNITLDCNLQNVSITSCKNYLEIVWNNLISNAIKFTEPNGKISISLKKENDFAVISIKDTGCGISPETGKYIFDKFYQGDTSHSSEGNGLGLALVKKVIDVLGGEISVESKPQRGSTFIVRLKI